MTAILALLLSVSPADRADWPPAWQASHQYDQCGESIANLKKMRSLVGYEDGRWDLWIRQTEEHRAMWGVLAVADTELTDEAMCIKLREYLRLVGKYRYWKRWNPPMPDAPYPNPVPYMPSATTAGNAR